MVGPDNCIAVIPCFNEGRTVAAVVAALRRQLPAVLVVDDGSTDATAPAAGAAGAAVLRHPRNRGKGAAVKTGVAEAARRGFEWAVLLDGDSQHDAADLPAFWQNAHRTGARLVIGNRMPAAAAMPWLRRQVNRWMSRQLSRRAGQTLPDTQCGFRLVHLPTWGTLALRTERYEIESEMLLAFLTAGAPVTFVPIQTISRRGSHIHPVTDSLRWWRWWRQGAPAGRVPEKPPQPGPLPPPEFSSPAVSGAK